MSSEANDLASDVLSIPNSSVSSISFFVKEYLKNIAFKPVESVFSQSKTGFGIVCARSICQIFNNELTVRQDENLSKFLCSNDRADAFRMCGLAMMRSHEYLHFQTPKVLYNRQVTKLIRLVSNYKDIIRS